MTSAIDRLLALDMSTPDRSWPFFDDQLITAAVLYCGTTRLSSVLKQALAEACGRHDVTWRVRNAGTALGLDNDTNAAKQTRRVAMSLMLLDRADLREIVGARIDTRLLERK